MDTTSLLFFIVILFIIVMAPVLSSNWKQLLANSKIEGPKKKTKPKDLRALDSQAKRKRLQAKETLKGTERTQNMQSGGSNHTNNSRPSASLALWAEDNDISAKDLVEAYGTEPSSTIRANDVINGGLARGVEIGQFIAIDCEMVGVGGQEDRSVLARVSIVNFHGTQVYDSFVRPKEFVTDWRTHVSGVSAKNMATARSFEEVQADVSALLQSRVLVGHAIKHDLDVLMLGHPKKDIRDTSRFSGFRKYSAGRTPGLKKLAKEVLGVDIQGGEHSSIEDARATMLLFRRFKPAFDVEHAARFPSRPAGSGSSKPKKKVKTKK